MLRLPTSSLLQGRARVPFAANSALARPKVLQVQRLLARAEGEGASSPAQQAAEEDGDLLIEKQLQSKRRKPKEPKAGPTVISPVRDQVYGGGPLTGEQIMENRVVSSLALLFLVILLEGLFLGASGFMSEAVDQFGQDVIYPIFSPSIALFLLGSSAYGLWKTYFQGQGGAPQK